MVNRYLTKSASQTKNLGAVLARKFLKTASSQKALTVALEGDLGGGKTTFLQGFARGMGIREKILSPTFILIRKHKIRVNSLSNSRQFAYFYHIDCYRFKTAKEISDLGFKEIISKPENIVAVEWADKIKRILPKKTIWIKFYFVGRNSRRIEILR